MATTQLTDVIVPEVYRDYMAVNDPRVTRLFESGIIARSELLDQLARQGGSMVEMPFWRDLDPEADPNISSDDPASESTPQKIEAGRMRALKAFLNQSWSDMDLVGELAGSDPMGRIVERTNRYWSHQWQRRLIASLVGILADNEANDDGDMVEDIATDEEGDPSDDELFGGEAFIDAELTLGDAIGEIQAFGVHSQVYARARKLDLIEFIRPSEAEPEIPTYQGKQVIVDDNLPAEQGTNRITYTTVLFGSGAIAYGEGDPRNPVEVDRKPAAGDGGGQEVLHERRTFLIHPFGYAVDEGQVSGQSATLSELESAAFWDRVVNHRKAVPLAFLKTNG